MFTSRHTKINIFPFTFTSLIFRTFDLSFHCANLVPVEKYVRLQRCTQFDVHSDALSVCVARRNVPAASGSFRLLAQHHRFQSALETYSIERMAKNFILLDSFIQRRSPLLTVIQRMLVGGGLVVFSAPLIARIGAKTYISFLGFFYARYAAQQINSLRTLIVKEEEKKKC